MSFTHSLTHSHSTTFEDRVHHSSHTDFGADVAAAHVLRNILLVRLIEEVWLWWRDGSSSIKNCAFVFFVGVLFLFNVNLEACVLLGIVK